MRPTTEPTSTYKQAAYTIVVSYYSFVKSQYYSTVAFSSGEQLKHLGKMSAKVVFPRLVYKEPSQYCCSSKNPKAAVL